MNKLLNRWIVRILETRGYDPYFANKIAHDLWQDLFEVKTTTLKQKLWALRRGFFSDKIELYGLNDQNYSDYLSDLDYYKMFPINGFYGRWIDDKLTMRLILQPFAQYLPEYYFQIGNGEILRLPDCPEGYGQEIQDVLALLMEKRCLAAKLFAGSVGVGFVKLDYENQGYSINDQPASEQEVQRVLEPWVNMGGGGYLITEYLHAHPALSRIWSKSANTVRVMAIRQRGQPPRLVGSYIRFGTSATGGVDNTGAGGLTCSVDIENGKFSGGKIFNVGKWDHYNDHPDSNVPVAGEVPFWTQITQILIEISNYIPQVIYLGYDVVIIPGGFKIIEINSHQALRSIQAQIPVLKNERTRGFFQGLKASRGG
jgi:hypothetical protein